MYNITQLLAFMKQNDSSDLYLTVNRPPCFKIQGTVRPAGKQPLTPEAIDALVQSMLSPEQYAELQNKKELNVALVFDTLGRSRGRRPQTEVSHGLQVGT